MDFTIVFIDIIVIVAIRNYIGTVYFYIDFALISVIFVIILLIIKEEIRWERADKEWNRIMKEVKKRNS